MRKTVEGTIAFAVAVILGAYVTAEVLPQFPFFKSSLANIRWPSFVVSTLLTGISYLPIVANDSITRGNVSSKR